MDIVKIRRYTDIEISGLQEEKLNKLEKLMGVQSRFWQEKLILAKSTGTILRQKQYEMLCLKTH
ncbi:MAG: hypothetical protein ACYTXI_34435 [Nostoc sp.]